MIALGILAATPPASVERPISRASVVLAVYAEDWGLATSGAPGLISVVWGDGYAIWSENQIDGGPPFYTGDVSPARLGAFLARLSNDGLFSDARLSQANFGPDSRFTSLLIRTGGKELHMQSWHEWAEHDGRAIATRSGIEALDGRARLSVLKVQAADYLYYRAVWAELRSSIQGLLPAQGQPGSGEVVMLRGVMSWKGKP